MICYDTDERQRCNRDRVDLTSFSQCKCFACKRALLLRFIVSFSVLLLSLSVQSSCRGKFPRKFYTVEEFPFSICYQPCSLVTEVHYADSRVVHGVL